MNRDAREKGRGDELLHVTGRSKFVEDASLPEGLLHGAVVTSQVSCGRITRMDTARASMMDGVAAVFTAAHIPGENQVGKIVMDEPLFAEKEFHYRGQPLALVVGKSQRIARKAAGAVIVEYEPATPVFDPRKAYEKERLIVPQRTFVSGEVEEAWKLCDTIVEGRADCGGQEHLYLETQAAYASPTEEGGVTIVSATQSPSLVQIIAARVLSLPMHHIEVDVPRLGGAFGGKEDQATPWAVMAALAAYRLKRPVRIVLARKEDMIMTGKRHPYSADFRIGLTREGKILAYRVMLFQNSGAAADLSPAILERSMFHATGSYYIPHVSITAVAARTNLTPNTAMRGFGAPQAMFVMECAIHRAAERMGISPSIIQRLNLIGEKDRFPYGMTLENSQVRNCWKAAGEKYRVREIEERIDRFNKENLLYKKGFSLMPVCFGISFTSKFLNQAAALVHVYIDGSVSVSTGAVEMGQGVKTKLRKVAARVFSIAQERVRVETTNTKRVANMSPTAASSGADLNGRALETACRNILLRLKKTGAKILDAYEPSDIEVKEEIVHVCGRKTALMWEELISRAYFDRVSLSAQAHFATPGIYFDREKEKGRPFSYHVAGTAITEVTLDCLRGTYSIDSVKVAHDFGESLSPAIDRGQVEGGVVQGIGWMTMEELIRDDSGRLQTDSLSRYRVPTMGSSPDSIEVHFLENSRNPRGVFNSKAIGEPPFMYGIGSFFAIISAMKAFRPDLSMELSAPMTPEKVLMALYP